MEGVDVHELVKRRNVDCIVEALVDHEVNRQQIKTGDKGVAYDFFYWGGDPKSAMVSVNWPRPKGINWDIARNYIEKPGQPIAEIRFVREITKDEARAVIYQNNA